MLFYWNVYYHVLLYSDSCIVLMLSINTWRYFCPAYVRRSSILVSVGSACYNDPNAYPLRPWSQTTANRSMLRCWVHCDHDRCLDESTVTHCPWSQCTRPRLVLWCWGWIETARREKMTKRLATTSNLSTRATTSDLRSRPHCCLFFIDDEEEGERGRRPGSLRTTTYNHNRIVIHILLMMREKAREGEDDHRFLICNQHQLQFNTNYNYKEEILLTHNFNSEEATWIANMYP